MPIPLGEFRLRDGDDPDCRCRPGMKGNGIDAMARPWHDEGLEAARLAVMLLQRPVSRPRIGTTFPRSSCHDLIMASMPIPLSEFRLRDLNGAICRCRAGMRSHGMDAMVEPWHDEGLEAARLAVMLLQRPVFRPRIGTTFPRSSCHDLIMASMPIPLSKFRLRDGDGPDCRCRPGMKGNGMDAMGERWHDEK
jgi:hypothetical protein